MHELQGRGIERLRLQDIAGREYPLRDELLFEQAILAHGKGMTRRQRSLVGRVIDALHRISPRETPAVLQKESSALEVEGECNVPEYGCSKRGRRTAAKPPTSSRMVSL